MGKPKKGNRGKTQVDSDDEVTGKVESLTLDDDIENGEVDTAPKPVKQKSKAKKAKSKKPDSDEENDEDDDEEEEDVASIGGKVTAKSAFQMLAEDNDSVSGGDESDDEKPAKPSEPVVTETQPAAKSQKGGKGKKKDQKKKQEEDDIDAILADLEKPAEKTEKGKKKKKGKEAVLETAAPPPEESGGLELKDVTAMTQEDIAAAMDEFDEDEYDKKKKKKDKKKGKVTVEEPAEAADAEVDKDGEDDEEAEETGEEGSTMKTAAQKKKEKKERQKLQKQQEKDKAKKKGKGKQEEEAPAGAAEEVVMETETVTMEDVAEEGKDDEKDEEKGDKKKKKKKGKADKTEEEEKKKKPSKMARAILEQQRIQREEEERIRLEEEEKERKAEEARQLKEEQERGDREKKEREKQKRKERMERKKAEGTYLTAKQKEDRRRAQEMLELMKAQGLAVPDGTETKRPKRVVYDNRKKKKQQQQEETTDTAVDAKSPVEETPPDTPVDESKQLPSADEPKVETEVKDSWEEEVKDSWDVESDHEDEKSAETTKKQSVKAEVAPPSKSAARKDEAAEEENDEESDEEDEEESDSSEEESSDDDSYGDMSSKERRIEKTKARIAKRKEENEAKRTLDNLRAPVVCVLGHVDTGKTKILDNLRRTNVQDGEAGGITQQIGATNVPKETIRERTKMCKEFFKKEFKLPGLLIIDTPGHESFSNLRSRGSSLCDIAILVVDIMHGLEPQTIESLNLLRDRKCPFIVALNKIDRLYDWKTNPHNDIVNTLKKQEVNTRQEFDERVQSVVVQFAEQGLNACLAHENKNLKEYISMVPTSAHSGDGMGNLMALVCDLTQNMLTKRISYSEELEATVMEVKAIPGLGTTIDVILVNGRVKEGDTIIVAGQEGPIVTQIRGLLTPQPLRELRVKANYIHHKEIQAAQGIKLSAKDLEKALAGLPMYIGKNEDEVEVYKEELEGQLKDVLGSIRLAERGVFVQASTLGSLEALLEFLRTSKIPYSGINIGPVHKKDIMKASVMLEHDVQYATILAFDVKVERDAQEIADNVGVRIFTAEIIYHLFDQFMKFRDDLRKQKQDEFKDIAVFPCKIRVLPQYIFNSRDPIVMGVIVESGFVKEGTPICVPSKEFLDLGRITSVESNHKVIEKATKGMEVCIKIEPIPGDAPKMFGRHFDETDPLVSKISRDSIDAVKNYFRDEMTKMDWQLIMELKKVFEIL